MRFFRLVPLLIWLGLEASAQTLKIGWLPYTNALSLVSIHAPVRDYLAGALDQEVEILSAVDYAPFHEATLRGEFDLIVTGPHLGALAVKAGFVPLFTYQSTLKPLFVVRKGSPVQTPADLKGKKVALSNPLSVSSIGGLGWLHQEGLERGKDFTAVNAPSHPSAIQSVIIGENDAAITTHTPVKQLAPELLAQVRSFETPFALPHLFTLANPALGEAKIEKIRAALTAFEATETGKTYFEKTGYGGFKPLDAGIIKQMDGFLPETLRLLESER